MAFVPADQVETLVAKVADLFRDAEARLLARMAESVAKGLDSPHWAEEQMLHLARYRRQSQKVIEQLRHGLSTATGDAVFTAATRGQAAALATLGRAITPTDAGRTTVDTEAVIRLAGELTGTVQAAAAPILRVTDDAYRKVIADVAHRTILGEATQQQAAQDALDEFARRGITSFVGRTGRRMRIEHYVEMSVRSSLMNAAVQGHIDRLQDMGTRLVVISDVPQECKLCRPWEGKTVALDGDTGVETIDRGERVQVDGTLAQARAAGLFHPGCVVGDTRVSPGGGVGVSDARWYEGPVAVIKTAGGDELTITPNHPVLTPNGWVAAGELVVGAHVVRDGRQVHGVDSMSPDEQQVPPRIREVHGAFLQASQVLPVRVPTSAHDFHGDGGDSEVEVVSADSLLKDGIHVAEHGGETTLLVGGVRLPLLLGASDLPSLLFGVDAPTRGLVGSRGELGPLCAAHATEAARHRLASRDGGVPVATKAGTERGLGESDDGASLLLGELAGEVTLDSVVEVGVRDFAGHVYNLQCENGWYSANSIVVHNCRHSIAPWRRNMRSFGETADPQGDKDRQTLRRYEREVRAARREELVALDDDARKAARRKAAAWQARIRQHVAATSAKRQPDRERITGQFTPAKA